MKISLDPRPQKASVDVYIGRRECDEIVHVSSFVVNTERIKDFEALPGPSCEMTINELVMLSTSLQSELTRLGYMKTHPSVEVVEELRARVYSS